ncbi:hypothetical protein [Streptomyces sp. NRRL WC-3618]|nr:hypothetical protein [Streptomyces sp. NRRL WC-3618]
MLALLSDGSFLTRIGGVRLRVIEAEIHSRTADGDEAEPIVCSPR